MAAAAAAAVYYSRSSGTGSGSSYAASGATAGATAGAGTGSSGGDDTHATTPSDYLSIRVTDTGPGFAGVDPESLLQPFVTDDSANQFADGSSTTQTIKGTGLGLAMCKLLAKQMNGWIVLHDRQDGVSGAVFGLDLPLVRLSACHGAVPSPETKVDDRLPRPVHVVPPTPLTPFPATSNPPATAPGRPRILVADDHNVNARLTKSWLKRLKCDSVTVAHGQQLMDQLATAGPFDLVLTDLHMPFLNGDQALAEARARGIRTPFVVVTGDADTPAKCMALIAKGFVDVLPKPFDKPTLAALLRKYVAL